MIQLREQYWAVEVPEGANVFDVNQYGTLSELNYWTIIGNNKSLIVKDLPPGTWEIVCTSKEATKKQAKQIVEMTHPGGFGRSAEEYKNYTSSGICFCPVYSLETLLTSKGCDLKNNYLILKKTA